MTVAPPSGDDAAALIKEISNQGLGPSLRSCLKTCQIKDMSNQKLPVVRLDTTAACCEPLAREPLSPEGADELAPLFKAVADPMRLRLLSLIACHDGGESCVCDLTAAFDVTAPTVSYHLKILREAGLISAERRGTWVYYRVNPQVMARMSAVLLPQPAALAGKA
jgi:ArsR family transcriptional regulator, arsenate/arsenite/antimonite-responsive transcriptional repressor